MTARPGGAGRVRWSRFAIVVLPALTIAGLLTGLTARGAIAASISVSGAEFLVTADRLTGSGFQQYPGQLTVDGATAGKPVIIVAIHNATLTKMCQSVSVAGVTLRLTAGDGSAPVSASNLVVDVAALSGETAQFKSMVIGSGHGQLGEQADRVIITRLRQDTWLTTAGTFSLPGLALGFGSGCLTGCALAAHQPALIGSWESCDSPLGWAGTWLTPSALAFSASVVASEHRLRMANPAAAPAAPSTTSRAARPRQLTIERVMPCSRDSSSGRTACAPWRSVEVTRGVIAFSTTSANASIRGALQTRAWCMPCWTC